ncbi:MAG: HEAT repeat domain-containing protein [Lentisphaerae bacterium]|nr:HEAT repeat domain-containing protein [Lentisphaerota bacterium]
MTFSPEIRRLAAMLDDPDNDVAVNVAAQLLASDEDIDALTGMLQESPDPLVRRRVHVLQNAIAMRYRRRKLFLMLNGEVQCDVFEALILLHLLWFDKDQYEEVAKDVQKFMELAAKSPLSSLEDAEIFMRKHSFLPENETTIRPESYCIGTVLFHHLGASSILLAILWELLGQKGYSLVRVLGRFGLRDSENRVLLGGGAWQLTEFSGNGAEEWSITGLLRYIGTTLLSCAVNSDSYRYVMSITRALTGDESEHVFDGFPYPFASNPEEFENEQNTDNKEDDGHEQNTGN